jgi:hypothetical protein
MENIDSADFNVPVHNGLSIDLCIISDEERSAPLRISAAAGGGAMVDTVDATVRNLGSSIGQLVLLNTVPASLLLYTVCLKELLFALRLLLLRSIALLTCACDPVESNKMVIYA